MVKVEGEPRATRNTGSSSSSSMSGQSARAPVAHLEQPPLIQCEHVQRTVAHKAIMLGCCHRKSMIVEGTELHLKPSANPTVGPHQKREGLPSCQQCLRRDKCWPSLHPHHQLNCAKPRSWVRGQQGGHQGRWVIALGLNLHQFSRFPTKASTP
jgi:hypothetical protein